MSADFSQFPWPSIPPSTSIPRWNGNGFALDGHRHPVLCYAKKESNWSDDLTELHEQEAGRNHPIDVASRYLAKETIRQYCLHSGATVLEAGSSSGYLLEELQAEFPSLRLIGSDFIAEPLEKLAASVPSIPLLQFDLRDCPLPSDLLDGVVLLNVLEHIDDDRGALQHVARILKQGGCLHVEVPSNPDCFDIYDEHLMHHRRYRLAELTLMLQELGFEIIKATHLGCFIYPPFWMVKKRNRRFLSFPKEQKQKIVASQIRGTKESRLLALCVKFELWLGKVISYPFGIRCVVTARKKKL